MGLETTIDSKQSATALAVEVLDELRVSVLECLLALDAIGEEAAIDFVSLTESLAVSGWAARQAFVAASLLHQDAELSAPCCEDNFLTPGSIIKRHMAAVAGGAAVIFPDRSDVDDFETEVGSLFAGAEVAAGVAEHAHLGAATTAGNLGTQTSPDCALGSGRSAISLEEDRDGYRTEIEAVLSSRRQRNLAMRRETIRAAGTHVVQQWMTRRASLTADSE